MSDTDPFARRPVRETAMLMTVLVLAFAAAAMLGWRNGPFWGEFRYISAGLAAALLALSLVDLDRFLLPNILTFPLIGLGLAYSWAFGFGIGWAIAGAVIGYGLIAGVAWLWRARFGREGIGLGDAKLLAAGGAWLSVFALPIVLLIASGMALLVIVTAGLFGRKIGAQNPVAFGPMLALAIWIVWCHPAMVP